VIRPRFRVSLTIALLAAACDPVHSNAVDALGDNPPGQRNGPLHRPGQPCLVCHDGAIGDPSAFTVAGTVYQNEGESSPAAADVEVCMTDATGNTITLRTNQAGNFYVTSRDFTPSYPMKVVLNCGTSAEHPMQTNVGRDGSCAGCHTYPPGPGSPGRVALADGGLP
jgi:hypothetical protein